MDPLLLNYLSSLSSFSIHTYVPPIANVPRFPKHPSSLCYACFSSLYPEHTAFLMPIVFIWLLPSHLSTSAQRSSSLGIFHLHTQPSDLTCIFLPLLPHAHFIEFVSVPLVANLGAFVQYHCPRLMLFGSDSLAQLVKNPPAAQETLVQFLGQEDLLEKGMATHSLIWLREFHGQRSLAGYRPWGHKESDMTERLSLSLSLVHTLTTTNLNHTACSMPSMHVDGFNLYCHPLLSA